MFPKNLAYNLKKLQGSINKQRVKILADNTSYKSTQQILFNLPRGAILDLRSLVIYATGATSGTGSSTSYVHFGRLGLHSLIENLTVSVNNITLSSIQSYNFLYNLLFDMEGGSIDQATKRMITSYMTLMSISQVRQPIVEPQQPKMKIRLLLNILVKLMEQLPI